MTRSFRVALACGVAFFPLLLTSCQDETIVEPTPLLGRNGGGTPGIVFYNGNVITMEPVSRVDEAILVRGSSIVATGSSERIRRMAGPNGIEVNLEGLTVMPGFVDPHNHTYNSIFLGQNADVVGTDYGTAQQALLEVGTTTIGNANVWPQAIDDFLLYVDSDGLRVRSTLYLGYNDICGVTWPEDWYLGYPMIKDPRAMLRIPGLKFFSDGGACGLEAYSWRADSESLPYFTKDELAAAVAEVQGLGYQAAIHAIGDVAVGVVLDALEIVNDDGSNPYRHRIEHNQIIREEQVPRYGEVGAVPVVFSYPWTCSIIDNMGPGWSRLNWDPTAFYVRPWFFPWRSLLDTNPGLRVAWKSDGPQFFWPNDPLRHLWGLVTRDDMRAGGSICEAPAWLEAGAVTVEQALQMMTINGAYALGMDSAIGSLRAGKLADLIVISNNPLDVEPDELKDLELLMTMVGGKVEHCQAGKEALCPPNGS